MRRRRGRGTLARWNPQQLKCFLLILPILFMGTKAFVADEPSFRMYTTESVAIEGNPNVSIGIVRDGPSAGRVEATLAWSVEGVPLEETRKVVWNDGEKGMKNVTIPVHDIFGGHNSSAVLMELVSVSRGSIQGLWSYTTITEPGVKLPEFRVTQDKVVTRSDKNISIVVDLVNGTVPGEGPALLKYVIEPVKDETMASFFPSLKRREGLVAFQRGQKETKIPIYIDWSLVPEYAQYHVLMTLIPVYKAVVLDPRQFYALHIFGVSTGSCPAGFRVKHNKDSLIQQKIHIKGVTIKNTSTSASSGLLNVSLYNGSDAALPLSWRERSSSLGELGVAVGSEVSSVRLCVDFRSTFLKASDMRMSSIQENGAMRAVPAPTVGHQCRERNSKGQGTAISWNLDLPFGPSIFNLTVGSLLASRGQDSYNYSGYVIINVLRKSDIRKTFVRSIKISPNKGDSFFACEGANEVLGNMSLKEAFKTGPSLQPSHILAAKPCMPGAKMSIKLDTDVDAIQVHPTLATNNSSGMRVEINGQVLAPLTASPASSSSQSINALSSLAGGSWPPYVLGIPQHGQVSVQIVVFGEDGTTSSSYVLVIERDENEGSQQQSGLDMWDALGGILFQDLRSINAVGIPNKCEICPSGTYSSKGNSASCELCPPGTVAAGGSFECTACPAGTYSMSWGGSICKHCIEGTFSNASSSTSCMLCPDSETTKGDGQSSCSVDVGSANLKQGYAVVVHMSLFVTDVDEESLVLKAGVDAAPHTILSDFMRTDIASAFNTTKSAVNVVSMRKLPGARGVETNLSAAIPVYVPPSATEEDISTALEVQKLSADSPIELLSKDPDAFFGRTTEILNVHVQSISARAVDQFPNPVRHDQRAALIVPGSLGLVLGFVCLGLGYWRSSKIRLSRADSPLLSGLPRSSSFR